MTGRQILGAALIALPFVVITVYASIVDHQFGIGVGIAMVFMACIYFGMKLRGDT